MPKTIPKIMPDIMPNTAPAPQSPTPNPKATRSNTTPTTRPDTTPATQQKKPESCKGDELFKVIGRPWNAKILWLLKEPTKFNQLKRDVSGITASILSDRVKQLQDNDLITQDAEKNYVLTARGQKICECIEQIIDIAQ